MEHNLCLQSLVRALKLFIHIHDFKLTSIQSIANNLQLAVGRISGEAYVQNNYFYGAIDDFHLFNRVLTAAEINTLYTTPYGGPATSAVPTSTGGPFVVPKFDPSFVDKTQLTGFDTPLGLTAAADGRIFVWQKSGKVYVIQNGQRSLFADITPLVPALFEETKGKRYGLIQFSKGWRCWRSWVALGGSSPKLYY